jgi:hypothetical protein
MTSAATTWQEIESRLAELAPDELPEVIDFLDYLAFRREKAQQADDRLAESQTPYRVVVKLQGLLKDYPITDSEVEAARK